MYAILILDDDDAIRLTMQMFFESELADCTVVAFAQGEAALAYLRQQTTPYYVFVDYLMPGMKGDEFLQRAHDELGAVPHTFILMTARKRELLPATLEAAIVDWHITHLVKPFDVDILLSSMEPTSP